MSHTTKINSVPIRSISALKQAALSLKAMGINCELVSNTKPRMYYDDQSSKLPYVLRLPDCRFDVGFEQQADGTYTPVMDLWNGHIGGVLGTGGDNNQEQIGKLLREYSKEVACEDAIENGYAVESCILGADGQYQIEILVD